jgi:hypothetical protein
MLNGGIVCVIGLTDVVVFVQVKKWLPLALLLFETV